MYVTTPSGCLRWRTASAARPRSKRLPSRRMRSPSDAERRSPSAARESRPSSEGTVVVTCPRRRSVRAPWAGGPPWPFVVEALEPLALFFSERIAERVSEVGAERVLGQSGLGGVGVGEGIPVLEAAHARGVEEALVFRRNGPFSAAPRGEHEGRPVHWYQASARSSA